MDFEIAYQQLSESWRIFYAILEGSGPRITEVVMHADPLAEKVMQEMLPNCQQTRKIV